jgi:hypothetical protein
MTTPREPTPLLPRQPGEPPPEAPPRLRDTLIVLRPLPDTVPVSVRLRRALKALLRQYGFRCLKVEDVAEGEPNANREKA